MSMTGKFKTEITLEKDALAGWLSGLAEAVKAGELPSDTGPVSLEGCRGMKISVKEGFGGGLRVKMSVKFPKPSHAPGVPVQAATEEEETPAEAPGEAESGLPKYKSMKKHMKQTFKAIGLALASGQMPPEAEAQSFIADAKLMVSYAGKGDEFYTIFLEKVQGLEQALKGTDVEAVKALHSELAQIKRECHSRHA